MWGGPGLNLWNINKSIIDRNGSSRAGSQASKVLNAFLPQHHWQAPEEKMAAWLRTTFQLKRLQWHWDKILKIKTTRFIETLFISASLQDWRSGWLPLIWPHWGQSESAKCQRQAWDSFPCIATQSVRLCKFCIMAADLAHFNRKQMLALVLVGPHENWSQHS